MAAGQQRNQKWSRLAQSQSLKAFPCRLLPKRKLPEPFCSITVITDQKGLHQKYCLLVVGDKFDAEHKLA
jgi:hypothetical protein